jgi:serine/threonine-protein kinase
VVHRDLKPANILVTAEGEPILLDFGIAKLLGGEEAGGETVQHARIMTPDYAAPEQILGEPMSAATDVYALGVVLYELLSGELPHRRSSGSPVALAAEVAGEETERPSRRVRRLDPTSPQGLPLSTERERERWARRLEGDLDTIVLSALRREAARRYPTATALREDIERFLAGRPIAARADSFAYRSRKFVSRHRLGIAAASVVLLSLVGGLVAALWQADRADRAALLARRQAARANQVKSVLVAIFRGSDPAAARGRTITASELLATGAGRISSQLAGDPSVAVELLGTVAEVENGLGLYPEAAGHARRAIALARQRLGPGAPELLAALDALAVARSEQRDFEAAGAAAGEALLRARRSYPRDSLEVARAASIDAMVLEDLGRSTEALALEQEAAAIDRIRLGPEDLATVRELANVAVSLDSLERYDESIATAKKALALLEQKLGPGDPEVARVCHNLGSTLTWTGRYAEAEPYFQRAIAIRRRALGPHHPWLAFSLREYSNLLTDQGRHVAAIAAGEEALAIYRAIDPAEPHIPSCLNAIAVDQSQLGHYGQALAAIDEALALGRPRLGEDSAAVLAWRSNRGFALAELGRLAEAERELEATVALDRQVDGAESTPVAGMLRKLGIVHRLEGHWQRAAALHAEALRILGSAMGEDSIGAAAARLALAQDLLEAGDDGQLPAAEAAARRALAAFTAADAQNPRVIDAGVVLARVRLARGARAEAQAALEKALAEDRRRRGEAAPQNAEVRLWLALAIDPATRSRPSRELLAEAARELAALHGEDHPLTRLARRRLAG